MNFVLDVLKSLKTFLCVYFQNTCDLREIIYQFKAKNIINLYLLLNSLCISQVQSLWLLLLTACLDVLICGLKKMLFLLLLLTVCFN